MVVDASMTDLIRPALYSAYHHVVPITKDDRRTALKTVVGPVCESGDFLAREVNLLDMDEGDMIAVMDTGAYAASMASNYNMRGRAMEILVDGTEVTMIAERETFEDIISRFETKEKVVDDEVAILEE